ncbi:MAG: winged helix-turn-helix domain-containing protein [Thermoguttaceae bacterium]|nr:winged helix-turn-helix domain-containing protein [Thermoguttaceae bacterium]
MKASRNQPAVETIFRALSERIRLRILNLLREGEVCVCDLVDVLQVPQPTASRHLAYLRRAGLVEVRKEGQWCYYRLAPPQSAFRRALAECLVRCADENPVMTADARRLRKVQRERCCADQPVATDDPGDKPCCPSRKQ